MATNEVENISIAVKATGVTHAKNSLEKLANTLQTLEQVASQLTGLDAVATSVSKIGSAVKTIKIDKSTTTNIQQVSTGLGEVGGKATAIQVVNSKLTNTNKIIQKTGTTAASSSTKVSSFLTSLTKNIISVATLRMVGNALGQCVSKANEYVESYNLFTVALGDYADEAEEYAERVSGALGIDTAEWERAQGTIMTLVTGFGVVSDRAYTMSKNLTQLGYDLSSFFNISVSDAMAKIESGIAGELEPLRRLGYDLSQTKLQAVAMSLGIDKSVTAMTQAEKAELRYYAIMTQVTTAQGDMARTIESPANQIRVLKAQFEMLARSIGNIFIPALNKVLPVCIAIVEVLRDIAEQIAEFFGYELPTVDYSSVSDTTAEVTDNIDEATDSTKELKRQLMGFDEINKLSDTSSSSSSSSSDSTGGSAFGFDLPEYDFLGDAVATNVDKIKKKLNELMPIIKKVTGLVGLFFAAWKIAKLINSIKKLTSGLTIAKIASSGLFKALTLATGITLSIAGIAITYSSAYRAYADDGVATSKEILTEFLGVLATAIGGALIGFNVGGVKGAVIGFVIGLAVSWAVGLKGSLDGVEAFAEKCYQATEKYREMSAIIENSSGILENSTSRVDELKASIDNIADNSASVGAAKNLVDEIYDLSDKASLSTYEMGLLETKVETLNNLGIDDLTLSLDETTGKVKEQKDEVLKLIDAYEEEIKVAALEDVLTSAYKSQYAAQYDITSAYNDNQKALEEMVAAKKELAKMDDWSSYKKSRSTEYQEAEARAETAVEAYNESAKALASVTAEYDAASDAIAYYSDQLAKIKTGDTGTDDTDTLEEMVSYGENVMKGFDEGAEEYYQSEAHKGFWATVWDDLKSSCTTSLDEHSPSKVFHQYGYWALEGFYDGAKSMWDRLVAWWESLELPSIDIKLPHMSWSMEAVEAGSITEKVLNAIGLPAKLPKLNVEWYAQGGFPSQGQLFVANESGPEMVGSMGGHTAVANNEQITEGIYRAVLKAMRDSGGNSTNSGDTTFIAQLNGKTLFEEVVKQNKTAARTYGKSPLSV